MSFYNTPNISKLYYFTILLKYYFLIFLYYFFPTRHFFFQIQLFQRSINFQQPAIFFFNFFPTISTTCHFFFFFLRKNMPNINVLKLANFKNAHSNFPCRLRPFFVNLTRFFSIFRARLVRDF